MNQSNTSSLIDKEASVNPKKTWQEPELLSLDVKGGTFNDVTEATVNDPFLS